MIKTLTKLIKRICHASVDFYEKLTEKQKKKFDEEKDSFTIDFNERSFKFLWDTPTSKPQWTSTQT